MNTHDVSDAPQFTQLLLKQKQNLRDAQSRKGQQLKGRKSREEIILQFRFRLMMKQGRADCKFNLGTYLLLRSITPPDRMTAIMAIVEDENRDVLMLQLYYQEEENERAAEEVLEEGTVLIVKEPYLKLMSDGDHGIRIDHLSDVIYFPMYDERVPKCWQLRLAECNVTASAWKAKGNDYFNESKYHAAIGYYTKALDCSPTVEEAHTLRLNRSLAFLKTKQFDAALSDLESASTNLKPTEKALFRKTQALYNLQRYRECCEVLKILRMEYPSNIAAKRELTRAVNRLAEQEKGGYLFKQLYLEATKLRPPHLDHSTYVGPVSLRASGSRGRGLFTTEAVKAGDLLLCEKAFVHAFVDTRKADNQDVALLINAETNSITMGSQAELIRMIVQKLYLNPSLAAVITDLHHGSYKPVGVSNVDGTPVVDTFLIERIISLNCFGCPLSSRESHLHVVEDEMSQRMKEEQFHSCGIWPMASYINHCCYSNARRAFIGDMMVVRATRDLAPDTEITFWYQIPVANGYDKRQKKFQHWGFKCDCTMCQDDQTTKKSVLAKRQGLRADALKYFQSGKRTDVAKIEIILATMADTYTQPAFEVPHLSIWDLQLALTQMYMQQKQPVKVIDSALRVLASLGYVIDGGNLPRASGTPMVVKQWGLMMDRLIERWVLLSGAYRLVAPDLEAQAEEYARISYRICIGEDEAFDETYGKLSDLNARP
ncbi:related to TPR domain protein [Phialocephala subalpina]|uniref:Related to TPR domain protein n=1 Tax=Phialocephala subalpina TaxID=576137 RepID=A0A1L7WID5_9HELO|nr:related to TPR domain protein [Phialocephala subalpina]